MVKISEYETRVLRAISKNRLLQGNKCVAISAAARRLEKKGMAGKGYNWYITSAGEAHLASLEATNPT